MMPNRLLSLVCVIALTALSSTPLHAAPPPPVKILNASVDLDNNLLTVNGADFGDVAPTVYLDGFPITLTNFDATHVVGLLPAAVATNAGSYLLTITRFDHGNQTSTASFVPTVGANGKTGPAGPTGRRAHRASRAIPGRRVLLVQPAQLARLAQPAQPAQLA